VAAIDLTTYTGLKDAVAQWLNRRDLTDQIPGFIAMAHAKFNRELRVRDMQTRAEATTSGEYIAVPADFLAPYSLELSVSPGLYGEPLEFVSEEEAKRRRAEGNTTQFRWYTIFGGEFELIGAPATDVDFKLKYYAKIPALSASNETNWLLTKSPDLYLYGACLEAAPYLKNDERLATWATMRQQVIDAMHIESERALKPQSKLVANRRGF
jgi:hypothetical protein